MKLVTRTLRKAIKEFNESADPAKRAKIAVRWFERNAQVTLEEMINALEERDR